MPLLFALASGQYDRVGLSTRPKQDSHVRLIKVSWGLAQPMKTPFLQTSSFRGVHKVRSTDNTRRALFTERNLPGTRLGNIIS